MLLISNSISFFAFILLKLNNIIYIIKLKNLVVVETVDSEENF